MNTFFTILSFPFRFFGIVLTIAPLTLNGVKINNRPAEFVDRVTAVAIGVFVTLIAYGMINIGA